MAEKKYQTEAYAYQKYTWLIAAETTSAVLSTINPFLCQCWKVRCD